MASLTKAQVPSSIDLGVVKSDMITYGSDIIPKGIIQKKDNTLFNAFYVGQFCLVHFPYKDVANEAMIKSSIIAVYRFNNKVWEYVKLLPYNYNLSILNEMHPIFLSDNLFCSPNGDCLSYVELAVFENMEMKTISSYEGFDKTRYYDGLLSAGEDEDVKKVVGDTVTSTVKLTKFIFDRNGIKCYEKDRRTGVLVGVSDSLTIEYKNVRNTINVH